MNFWAFCIAWTTRTWSMRGSHFWGTTAHTAIEFGKHTELFCANHECDRIFKLCKIGVGHIANPGVLTIRRIALRVTFYDLTEDSD